MSRAINAIYRPVLLIFAITCILNYFLKIPVFEYVSAAIILLVVIRTIPMLDKPLKILVSCILLTGSLLLILSNADHRVWITSIIRNANLIAMLICVPMIALPFYYRDYQEELKSLAQTRMQSILGFCLLVSLFTHLLGVLLSVSALAIVYELFKPQAKLYKSEDTFITTVMRSHSSAGFWSPAFASMVLITSVLSVQWVSLIPIGLLFAVLLISMDLGSIAWKMKRKPEDYSRLNAQDGVSPNWKMISTMLILSFILIGTLVIASLITPWELFIVIPLVAVIFPLLVGVVQNHIPEYKKGMSDYYNSSLPKLQSQFAVFAAAGFFGKTLDAAGIGEMIPQLLPTWLISYPAFMIAAIMLLLILPALIGVHPAATGTALLAAVAPEVIGLDVMSYSLTILTGFLLATFLSPLTVMSLIISGCSGRPAWSLLRLNYKFGIAALIIFSLLISVTGPLLS